MQTTQEPELDNGLPQEAQKAPQIQSPKQDASILPTTSQPTYPQQGGTPPQGARLPQQPYPPQGGRPPQGARPPYPPYPAQGGRPPQPQRPMQGYPPQGGRPPQGARGPMQPPYPVQGGRPPQGGMPMQPIRPQQGGAPARWGYMPVQPQKPSKKMTFSGVMCVLLLVVMIALAGCLYFDFGGARDLFISAFGLEKATRAQYDALEKRVEELDEREAGIDARIAELDVRESGVETAEDTSDARVKELDKREKELDTQEADLKLREQTLEARTDEVEALAQEVESWKTDISAAAQMYAKMDAKVAAQTLAVDANPAQIARLLMKMDSTKAAAILENFTKELRKEVTDEMAP